MTKLKDLARVTRRSMEENGPVTVRKLFKPKTDEVLAIVQAEPGLSAAEITFALGGHERDDITKVAKVAWVQTQRTARPLIKRLKQDGVYRYYPVNYHLSNEIETPKPGTITDRVLNYVLTHPGCDFRAIKQATGVQGNNVSSILDRAYKQGKVTRQGTVGSYHYYAQPTVSVLEMDTDYIPTVDVAVQPNKFEQMAKDYVWDNDLSPAQIEAIKDFIVYTKKI